MKKFGFTLAEVLITLGIIGVVAAITIPSLTTNFQKRAWATQAKQTYAVLQQGFKMARNDTDTDNIFDSEMFTPSGYDYYVKTPEKYLKMTKLKQDPFSLAGGTDDILPSYKLIDKSGFYNGDFFTEMNVYILVNGSILYFPYHVHSYNSYSRPMDGMFFAIDTNGMAGPNILGRDLFGYIVDASGTIYPYGEENHFTCHSANGCDLGNYDPSAEKNYSACNPSSTDSSGKLKNGEGCAARLMFNDWVMDY